jgi:hypothetical protein
MPMTDEEVDAKLCDDPFWHNIIKVEQNAHRTIENMRRGIIATGFGPTTSTCSAQEAAPDQDNVTTQETTFRVDDNGAQARPVTWTRAYTGVAMGDNNEDDGDEEEVSISWQRSTGLEQGGNNEDYLETRACRYKRLM